MSNNRDSKRFMKQGFSMLELIIIIMILTVLATVMSPMFFHSQESANLAKGDSEVDAIVSSLRMYYAQKGRFPKSATVADATENVLTELKTAGMIPDDKLNDPWGRPPKNVATLAKDAVPEGSATDDAGYYVFYTGTRLAEGSVVSGDTPAADHAIVVGYHSQGTGAKGPTTGKAVVVIDTRLEQAPR